MVWTLKKPKLCGLKGSTPMTRRLSPHPPDGSPRTCPGHSKGNEIADFQKSTALCNRESSLVQSQYRAPVFMLVRYGI